MATKRGKLIIFLGIAAGVGKTFAMLREGRHLKKQGYRVIIGFVDPHQRIHTEAQISDLEIFPYRYIPKYQRGEMDGEKLLDLHPRPDYVIIDEMAHEDLLGLTYHYQHI